MNKNDKLNVDNLIQRLLEVKKQPETSSNAALVNVSEAEVTSLLAQTREIFMDQPVFLELEAPIKICGKCYAFRSVTHGGTVLSYLGPIGNEPHALFCLLFLTTPLFFIFYR